MELISKSKTGKKERPVKVLQFGEGNFLRGFVDYMIDIANEKGEFDGDIVLVKPIEFGTLDRFRAQESQYTVSLRGIVDGEATVQNRIVTSVTDVVAAHEEYEKYSAYAKLDTLRYIVSNTTEAGIVFDEKPYICIVVANKGGNIGAYTQVLKMINEVNNIMSEYKTFGK